MDFRSVTLHPEYPQKVWVIVEQPRDEPDRFAYDPVSQSFYRTPYKSLLFARGFSGVYGWIGGSGIPPDLHYDVMLFTVQFPAFGDILEGYICGVFIRKDRDNKFAAVDGEIRKKMASADLSCLSRNLYEELLRLYPRMDEGEGWFGAETAFSFLLKKPEHD